MTTATELSVREKAIAAHVEAMRQSEAQQGEREARERQRARRELQDFCLKQLGVELSDDAFEFDAEGNPETDEINGLRLSQRTGRYTDFQQVMVALTCSRPGCTTPELPAWKSFYSLETLGALLVTTGHLHDENCEAFPEKPAVTAPSIGRQLVENIRSIVREEIENSRL